MVRELTDLCDYAVINISTNKAKASGLKQFYTNPTALEKLLRSVSSARLAELGKMAAAEFELVTGDNQDYLSSV
jgi:dihydroorotate dehydrogenase